MKNKQIAVLTILAASLPFGVTVVKADTVVLNQGNYSYAAGGEFTAITSPTDPFLQFYAPDAKATVGSATGFQTFCIETGVEFTPGHSYFYTLGNQAMPFSGGGTGSAAFLTTGAAWLYYEFGTENLSGYNYQNNNITSLNPSRETDAGLLQAAIWWFQGKQTYSGYATPTIVNNPFYADVEVYLSSNDLTDSSLYGGSSVEILQMWSNANDTGAAQNQLVLTSGSWSVPDGGMTIALLGGALIGLQVLRRKLA